jgi:hypothetical protein
MLGVPIFPSLLAFFRGHILPLFSEFLTFIGRQAPEPPEPVSDFFLFLRGKLTKFLVAGTNPFLLFRRKFLPLPKASPDLLLLLCGHTLPLFSSFAEPFLAFR